MPAHRQWRRPTGMGSCASDRGGFGLCDAAPDRAAGVEALILVTSGILPGVSHPGMLHRSSAPAGEFSSFSCRLIVYNQGWLGGLYVDWTGEGAGSSPRSGFRDRWIMAGSLA